MTETVSTNNKRVAKNTMMLYLRMGVSMIVGLYTSRVVLQTLGVEDYGIYGVVGGIVTMLGFLNSSMSGATSRFLTFELGKGKDRQLAETFVSAFWIHLIIAGIILLLSETVGLWFLYNKLVIPSERIEAAFWVFQFSIASAVVSITQVPYNASIISHEDMGVYAYVEIINVFLKLLIVYCLLLFPVDKLILYAFLYFLISLGIAIYYRRFCWKHYDESKIKFVWNASIVKKMSQFCGWDLYGNGCSVAKQQGINFLVNMFFGVTLNAAVSVSSLVGGTISGFTTNLSLALRPSIIKSYAVQDLKSMQNFVCQGMRYVILLQSAFSLPVALESNYILDLWLGNVPPFSALFCQWMLVSSVFSSCIVILNTGIHATGNIKSLSYISGSISLIQVPILFFMYKAGMSPEWAYILGFFGGLSMVVCEFFILNQRIKDFRVRPLFVTFLSTLIFVFISIIPSVFLFNYLPSSFLRCISVFFVYILTLGCISYWFIIPTSVRDLIKRRINCLIK